MDTGHRQIIHKVLTTSFTCFIYVYYNSRASGGCGWWGVARLLFLMTCGQKGFLMWLALGPRANDSPSTQRPWAQHSLIPGGNHVTVTAISNNYSISVADGKYFMIDTKWGETGDCLESAPGWSWSERIPVLSQEPGLIHCSWLSSKHQPLQPCTIV